MGVGDLGHHAAEEVFITHIEEKAWTLAAEGRRLHQISSRSRTMGPRLELSTEEGRRGGISVNRPPNGGAGAFISDYRGGGASDSSLEDLSATPLRRGARPHFGITPKGARRKVLTAATQHSLPREEKEDDVEVEKERGLH